MMVSCTKCSKMLKVKDEFAGKMLKCPQCGNTFKADPTGKVINSAPSGAAKGGPQPTGKPVPKPKGKVPGQQRGGISINWGMLIMIGLASLVPLAIILFLMGPMRVKKHWEANSEKAENTVTEVVEYAMKCYASTEGTWDPNKSGGMPSVGDLRFLPNIFTMSAEPTVKFDGYGTVGRFEGEYTYETGEVRFTLKAGGTMLSGIYSDEEGTMMTGGGRESTPAGGVPKSKGKLEPHQVAGRISTKGPEVRIDGKPATIFFPPKLDDDGNPIVPEPEKTPSTSPDKSKDKGKAK